MFILFYFIVISPVESIKNCTPNSRLNGWCPQLDSTTSELKQVEQNLKSLNRILDQLESNDNDVSNCYSYICIIFILQIEYNFGCIIQVSIYLFILFLGSCARWNSSDKKEH